MSSTPLIIIPARMDSKRLPGKPLLIAGGKPLIQHAYERALKTGYDVNIVTPDQSIMDACLGFTDNVYYRKTATPNGTARCANFVQQRESTLVKGYGWEAPSIIINWQCDEPMVDYQDVQTVVSVVAARKTNPNVVYTLVYPRQVDEEWADGEGTVYAATEGCQCHWFSREPIAGASPHIGIYIFTKESLCRAASVITSDLGQAEGLEQLSWIQAGMVVLSCNAKIAKSINTQLDFDIFKKFVESGAYAN